jgi:uncharacterized repeat protein (TIGR02543 family)
LYIYTYTKSGKLTKHTFTKLVCTDLAISNCPVITFNQGGNVLITRNVISAFICALSLCFTTTFAQSAAFSMSNSATQSQILIDKTITSSGTKIPISGVGAVTGLAVSGNVNLISEKSFARITMVSSLGEEFLVFEANGTISENKNITLQGFCEETRVLDNVTPAYLTIDLSDAIVAVSSISTSSPGQARSAASISASRKEQASEKLFTVRNAIKRKNLRWVADETSVSKLSYNEKKQFFGGKVPNLYGFEYYVGGVFEIPSTTTTTQVTPQNAGAPLYVSDYSWRNKHGQNWMTPVKNQGGCGSCWAFAAVGATEMLANVYFNRHLDLDLSEQHALSCMNGGGCGGGHPGPVYDYIINLGIMNESCFPYTEMDDPCSNRCGTPSENIRIGSINYFNGSSEGLLKSYVIRSAANIGIVDWWHAITLAGYRTLKAGDTYYVRDLSGQTQTITIAENDPLIGRTVWEIKNSWGDWWGDNGYCYVITDLSNIYLTYGVNGPVTRQGYTNAEILCTDSDGDGYYCWGTGTKPSHCPTSPAEADGDDSDPSRGPMNSYGYTEITCNVTSTSDLSTNYSASMAIDNDPMSRWSSQYNDPQSITYDLRSPRSVRSIEIEWGIDNARNYTISGASSLNGPWTVLSTKTNMAPCPVGATRRIDNIAGLTGTYRYYRVTGTVRNTTNGYSIWETRFNSTGSSPVNFTLTTNAVNGSIRLDPAGGTYTSGAVVTATAEPAANYAFVNWSGDLFGDINPSPIVMNANKTITANFVRTYTITATAGANGSIDPSGTRTVNGGTNHIITISPNAGYVVDAVIDNGVPATATNNYYTISNVSANHTITVSFKRQSVLIQQPVAVTTASSQEMDGTLLRQAIFATDGNITTRWSSLYSDPQWIVFDMGSAKPITAITIDWEAASARDYIVEGSNDASFNTKTTLISKSNMPPAVNNHRIDELTDLTGSYRYYRVYGNARNTIYGYSIWEARLYTSGDNPINYTLTTNVVGSGSVALTPAGGTYTSGTVVSLAAVPSSGFRFTGWSGDLTGTTNPASITMTSNKTVTANFAVNTFFIDASAGPNGTISPSGRIPVGNGENYTFSILPNDGYVVDAVTVDGTSAGALTSYTFNSVTSNHTINATFKVSNGLIRERNITAVGSSTEGSHVASNALDDNATSTRWGSAFSDPQHITFDLGSAKSIRVIVLDWETANGRNYTIDGSNDNFVTRTNLVTRTNMPAAVNGHRIDSISGITGTYRYYRVTGTVRNGTWGYSIWEARFYSSGNTTTYTLTTNAVNGTVTPNGGTFEANSQVTLNAAPNAGYRFVNWTGDITGTNSSVTITMNSNKNVTANFAANTFTINATAGQNGTITPSGSVTVNGGSNQCFTITPNSGYVIDVLTVDGAVVQNPTNNYCFNTVTANHTINVTFKPAGTRYTLTVSSANGTVTLSPAGGTYDAGTVVTATAVPVSCYRFANWTGDVSGTTNSVAITMNSNKNITANFTQITYSVTASAGANGTISPTSSPSVPCGSNLTLTITPAANYEIDRLIDNGTVVTATNNRYTITGISANHTVSVSFKLISSNLLTKYGVPRTTPLPSVNRSFTRISTEGTGAPSMSQVTKTQVNWSLENNGLWTFGMNTNNGVPSWWVDLVSKLTHNFGSANAGCTITGSGFSGFDGNYYVTVQGTNLILVERTGRYAITFQ